MSTARYMINKPAHFITRIANPYTRFGDKPYVKCPKCKRLCTNLGLNAHVRACKP